MDFMFKNNPAGKAAIRPKWCHRVARCTCGRLTTGRLCAPSTSGSVRLTRCQPCARQWYLRRDADRAQRLLDRLAHEDGRI